MVHEDFTDPQRGIVVGFNAGVANASAKTAKDSSARKIRKPAYRTMIVIDVCPAAVSGGLFVALRVTQLPVGPDANREGVPRRGLFLFRSVIHLAGLESTEYDSYELLALPCSDQDF